MIHNEKQELFYYLLFEVIYKQISEKLQNYPPSEYYHTFVTDEDKMFDF